MSYFLIWYERGPKNQPYDKKYHQAKVRVFDTLSHLLEVVNNPDMEPLDLEPVAGFPRGGELFSGAHAPIYWKYKCIVIKGELVTSLVAREIVVEERRIEWYEKGGEK